MSKKLIVKPDGSQFYRWELHCPDGYCGFHEQPWYEDKPVDVEEFYTFCPGGCGAHGEVEKFLRTI